MSEEATYEILYRERKGAGDDYEAENPNGILVTLSHWSTKNPTYQVPDFYLIEKKVMVNREFIVDEIAIQKSNGTNNAMLIRRAIVAFDYLVELYPQVRND